MFKNISPDLVRSGKFGCPVLSGQETHMPSPVEPYMQHFNDSKNSLAGENLSCRHSAKSACAHACVQQSEVYSVYNNFILPFITLKVALS